RLFFCFSGVVRIRADCYTPDSSGPLRSSRLHQGSHRNPPVGGAGESPIRPLCRTLHLSPVRSFWFCSEGVMVRKSNRLFTQGRPTIEVLEDRSCPAVSITSVGSHLNILGDDTRNVVTVRDNGAGAVTATITTESGVKAEWAGAGINHIDIKAAGG